MYGGLCALATFDRSKLHKEVLISNTFKLFLELEPQLRDVIINFYESKYGKCLTQLEDMRDNMMLDIYLASHVNTLFSMIRSRSLVQYFRLVLKLFTVFPRIVEKRGGTESWYFPVYCLFCLKNHGILIEKIKLDISGWVLCLCYNMDNLGNLHLKSSRNKLFYH